MKFWEGNRADAEFDWPVTAVADAFMNWYLKPEQAAKRDSWPLERMLRDWLTAPGPDGFNATWEAETGPDSFEELSDQVRERARANPAEGGI